MMPSTSAKNLRALTAALLLATSQAHTSQVHAADEPETGIPESSIAHNFPDKLDAGGRRSALANRGITYGLNYAGEVLGVADGGIRTGARYFGQLEGVVDIDFEKLAGWRGLTFHSNAQQLHGRGISPTHVGLLDPVSSIEATPATRLIDFWFEQDLVKEKLSVRFGQMRVDADGEFLNAPSGGLFLSTWFGWPAFMGVNMPSGGVSYPLAAPGVRLKYTATDKVTFLAAVFNDDPAGPCPQGDPQKCNNDGLKFRTHDDPFVIAEVQYKYGDNKKPGELAGLLKIGGFADLAKFEDQRFSIDGLSLADPASNGIARRLHSNRGLYAVIDQQIYRSNRSGAGANDGIFAFGRIAGLPADRNLVDFAFDGGLRFVGMVPGRRADEFGVGLSYNHISSRVAGLDKDTAFFTGDVVPVRSSEWAVEATYKMELAKGWYLQPDLQYIWRPGGNAADPNTPAKPIDNALVLGLRSTVNY